MNIDKEFFKEMVHELGSERTIKLITLYHSIDWYNGVDFQILDMSESGLKKFRANLTKLGYAKKVKINKNKKARWYLNPLYGNRGKVSKELWEAFKIPPGEDTY